MKKVMRMLLGGILTLTMVLSVNTSVFAAEEKTNKENDVSVTFDDDAVDAQLEVSENEVMWIEDDTMYKIEVLETDVESENSHMSTSAYIQISEKNLSIKEMQTPNVTLMQQKIKDSQNLGVLNQATVLSVTKSDQAWDSSYTLKATLSVNYSYSGNSLRIYSATGSYTRAAYNGVVVNSGKLRYSATGKIYTNGTFQRNGTVANTITSNNGTFSNATLMGNSTEVRYPTIGGVVYTIYASRGVYVEVPVSVV